ncbi:hypothetical protein [Clostridium novyi]|uniref:hypothetical protein n=1 Tax=Clostridium novyi TaxID=1542 RepID=UPI0012D2CABC|nr:hypothetical protein [Clostridium novyi]
MRDWKELALDDTLNEMDNVVPKEEKNLNTVQSQGGTKAPRKVVVPFCCVTTIPGKFTVPGAQVIPPQQQPVPPVPPVVKPQISVAWNSCLNLRLQRQDISVTACNDQAPCGTIPACVTKISGCIQFIASTPVQGNNTSTLQPDGSPQPSSSSVCCKGCVCVDQCVGCQLLQCAQPCPGDLGNFTIEVKNESVCIKTCEPCSGSSAYPTSQMVKFTGNFVITYNPPKTPAPPIPSPCGD